MSCCSARDLVLKAQMLVICSILQNSVSTDPIRYPFLLYFLQNQIKHCYTFPTYINVGKDWLNAINYKEENNSMKWCKSMH